MRSVRALLSVPALGGAVLVLLASLLPTAHAGPVLDRVRSGGVVRVCIWPDYYGITFRHPRTRQLDGVDIDLSAALGADLRAGVQYVESSFETLVDDLQADRCDVAMFAVGRTPQRMAQLRFTQPYLQSGIYGITTKGHPAVRAWSDIDQPGVLVGVQAGTFMESAMEGFLHHARLVVVKPPASRERELGAGRIDVFMTDYAYSRRLLDNADWARLMTPPQPLFVLPYAYAVRPGDEDWLNALDAFVGRIKADGRLRKAASRHGLDAIVVDR